MPLLGLLAAFLLGTLRVAERAQARAALQSRLDVCAVRLAVARERSYAHLAKANAVVEASKEAVYAARAAMLVPGAGEAAAAAAEVAVQTNNAAAATQEALRFAASAAEAASLRCPPDRYSNDSAYCYATPPLATALWREATLFPDVRGALRSRGGDALASVRCTALTVATMLSIRGDASLRRTEGYFDVYTR